MLLAGNVDAKYGKMKCIIIAGIIQNFRNNTNNERASSRTLAQNADDRELTFYFGAGGLTPCAFLGNRILSTI